MQWINGTAQAIFRDNANTTPPVAPPPGPGSVSEYPGPVVPVPPVSWQLTGNHWFAVPCIHPADGSIHAVGVVHRGSRSAVEFAGGPNFTDGHGPALLRPRIVIDGAEHALATEGIAWEHVHGWLPTFTAAMSKGQFVARGTIFAPVGRDADVPGAIYVITLENRNGENAEVSITLEGTLAHRQARVRTARTFGDAHRAIRCAGDAVLLDGAGLPGTAALAIAADDGVAVTIDSAEGVPRFTLRSAAVVQPGTTMQVAFYVAAAPERDGAAATVLAMKRRGWRSLLTATGEALRTLEQSTGSPALDRMVNRNLLFAYFYATARAIDDARFYLMRSRAPWNGRGVTVRDWDALTWTVPAVQLADAGLARELIIRACEIHGVAPGRGVHYIDGALFEPGFSIEGVASFAWATERYIRETGDDQIVEEPALADTLYASSDDLSARRHRDVPLYESEVYPSGAPVPLPYTIHANAVAALALDVFRRTLDAETAKDVEDPSAVRAALLRHFTVDREGKPQLMSVTDLHGESGRRDDAVGSVLWLPLYEAVDRQDSVYRRTVKGLAGNGEAEGEPIALARQCARLVGPDAGSALAWLRQAPLDNGLAAELLDVDGRAVANGADASLSGLLAYAIWYAVHALGVTP